MSQSKNASLFGGALLAAGITHAQPQLNLINDPASDEISAYARDYNDRVGFNSGFTGSFSYFFPNAGASVSLSPTLATVGTFSDAHIEPEGRASISVEFTVDNSTEWVATWDVWQEFDGLSFADFRIIDITNDTDLFSVNGGVGTQSGFVEAGNLYRLEMSAVTIDQSARIDLQLEIIPAPSTAAMLAAGGILAVRSRRA